MKTPEEILKFKEKIYEMLDWAIGQGHINEEQSQTLKINIEDIELELYPKETYIDENGWTQIKENC